MDKRSIQESSKEAAPNRGQIVVEQFNPNYKGTPGVENNEPSMTIPDMSYTVQELLLNHTRGIGIDVKNYEGQFFGEEIQQFDDITERIAYKNQLLKEIKDLETQIEDEKQAELLLKAEASEANQTDNSSE